MVAKVTQFQLTRDINGFNGFGLVISNSQYSATLAATADTTLDVPYGDAIYDPTSSKQQFIAIISIAPGAKVWVALNTSAESPVSSSFASTTSELNPTARNVKAGDVLHFYTTDSSGVDVGVTFYELLK